MILKIDLLNYYYYKILVYTIMDKHNDLVQKRLQELRDKESRDIFLEKQKLELAKQEKINKLEEYKKEIINYKIDLEAKMILYFEKLTNSKIIDNFTPDKNLNDYIFEIIKISPFNYIDINIARITIDSNTYNCYKRIQNCLQNKINRYNNPQCMYCVDVLNYLRMQLNGRHINNENRLNQLNDNDTKIHYNNFKNELIKFIIDYFTKYISNLVKDIYNKREEIRIIKESNEKLILSTKIIDATNIGTLGFLKAYPINTFIPLKITDLYKKNEYICLNKHLSQSYNYLHYAAMNINNPLQPHQPLTTNMPNDWISYYEEGKVPFFTKCPTCKSLTKFNYHKQIDYSSPCIMNGFNEIYCANHYFYEVRNNKHYVADIRGNTLQHIYTNIPILPYTHTEIKHSHTTKWREYNPKDPDGKIAEKERKDKEASEIQQQILQLQTRLDGLK